MRTKLNNGAKIIAVAKDDNGTFVILASWDRGGRREYVTWKAYHNDINNTVSGNYIATLPDAYQSFLNRQVLEFGKVLTDHISFH